MARQKTDVMAKVEKEFPEFVGVVTGLTAEKLNEKISVYAKELDKVDQELKNNEAIQSASEVLSELKSPFTDTQKAIKLKIRYLIKLLENMGAE